ncbi:MAG TPA: hypothetical protein HA364_06090 [Thermoplasmata archaeon]|nr:hypothetical protein [Thermoplasmata archaeon]
MRIFFFGCSSAGVEGVSAGFSCGCELETGFSSGSIVVGMGATLIENECPHSAHFLMPLGNE